MSLDAPALRKLAALCLSPDQMAGVLDVLASMTEAEEARKAAQRERTRKFREKIGAVTLPSPHSNSDTPRASVTRVEDNSLPQKIESQESKKESSARTRLESVLDAEHAQAVVDHRQRLRKPLTAYAAKLLADKLATFPDANAAVDRMIERGWLTAYPDDAPRARGSPSQSVPHLADIFHLAGQKAEHGNPDQNRERTRPALSHVPIVRTG